MEPNTENTVNLAENKFAKNHPYTIGAEILGSVFWKELVKSERTLDPIHHNIINNTYQEGILRKEEIFTTYKHLDDDDFRDPNSPWYTTSIIVSTNKERFTLTHTCAIGYAKARGKIVYR